MTVYVDEMLPRGQSKTWRHSENCHMIADSVEELNAMADTIGLKRAWLQLKYPDALPHYDLTAGKRRLAIQHGAVEITWREMARRAMKESADGFVPTAART